MIRALFRSLMLVMLITTSAHAGSSAFLMTLGRDTLAIERARDEGGRIAGVTLFRPTGTRVDWTLVLGADGRAEQFTTEVRTAAQAPSDAPAQVAAFVWRGDSVLVDVQPGHGGHFATTRGSLPYLNPSLALLEQVVRRARAATPPLDTVPVFLTSGGRTLPIAVRAVAADSVVLDFAGVAFEVRLDGAGRLLAGRVPAQGVTFTRVESLPEGLLATARPDYSAPTSAGYVVEDVRVPTGGRFTLAGTLVRPKGKGPFPCALLLTGSGPQERDEAIAMVPGYRPFRQIADTLARRGIASLRLDDRGTGASGGVFAGSTSADFADDAEDALKWLVEQRSIDRTRIAVLGHSEGGLIAPMLASRGVKLAALVLLAAPAWDGRRILHEQNRFAAAGRFQGASLDSLLRVADHRVDSLGIADRWTGWFLAHDPLAVARTLRTPPVLLLQGETDRQVTAGQADELAAAMRGAGNPSVTVHRLPETDHLFLPDASGDPTGYPRLPVRLVPPATLGLIADWLVATMRVAR